MIQDLSNRFVKNNGQLIGLENLVTTIQNTLLHFVINDTPSRSLIIFGAIKSGKKKCLQQALWNLYTDHPQTFYLTAVKLLNESSHEQKCFVYDQLKIYSQKTNHTLPYIFCIDGIQNASQTALSIILNHPKLILCGTTTDATFAEQWDKRIMSRMSPMIITLPKLSFDHYLFIIQNEFKAEVEPKLKEIYQSYLLGLSSSQCIEQLGQPMCCIFKQNFQSLNNFEITLLICALSLLHLSNGFTLLDSTAQLHHLEREEKAFNPDFLSPTYHYHASIHWTAMNKLEDLQFIQKIKKSKNTEVNCSRDDYLFKNNYRAKDLIDAVCEAKYLPDHFKRWVEKI